MFLLGLSLCLISFLLLAALVYLTRDIGREHLFLSLHFKKTVLDLSFLEDKILSLPFLSLCDNYLGKNQLAKLLLPSVLIALVAIFVLGPLLAGPSLGLLLGLVIALAYISRLFLHSYIRFRDSLLSQIERLLSSIRNNLSAGMTLDYAVNETASLTMDEPIASDLASFLVLAEANFLDNFPSWFSSLSKKFKIASLAKSAQLLGLELHYSNNQEEAFMDAAKTVANALRVNKKQKSTLNITLFTLDFMVLAFLALLFYVIPSFATSEDLSWWQSPGRFVVLFQSGLLIWLAYFVTLFLAFRRQA